MNRTRRLTRIALALAVVVVAAVIAVATRGGLGGGDADPNPTAAPTAGGGSPPGGGARSWIISGSTLTRLLATDRSGGTAAANFDTPDAYVLTGAADWALPSGWRSTPTADFTSYSALRAALTGNRLDRRVRAVLYDNEDWSLTPADERADPARYDRLAGQLVHAHHLLFIASPATDLVNTLAPNTAAGSKFNAFLNLGLIGQIARDADVLDLQAQGAEDDPALFASFVSAAAAQARAANPGIKVLAGLSTNPSGRAVTAAVIDRAAEAVTADVDGYWLNDPAPSAACAACVGPYPQVALAALRGLG